LHTFKHQNNTIYTLVQKVYKSWKVEKQIKPYFILKFEKKHINMLAVYVPAKK